MKDCLNNKREYIYRYRHAIPQVDKQTLKVFYEKYFFNQSFSIGNVYLLSKSG